MFARKRMKQAALMAGVLAAGLLAPALARGAGADRSLAPTEHVVKFRLADWKAQHFYDQAQAKTFADTVTRLGCEAKTAPHNDHVDVTYRCVEWRSLQAPSQESAQTWEKWLKQAGFETQHPH